MGAGYHKLAWNYALGNRSSPSRKGLRTFSGVDREIPTLSSEIQFHGHRRIRRQREGFKYVLVSLAVASKTYQPRSDPPQSGERGESVNRDNGISLSYDIMKTDLIFFIGNVGNSLGHAVSLR